MPLYFLTMGAKVEVLNDSMAQQVRAEIEADMTEAGADVTNYRLVELVGDNPPTERVVEASST
jgi:hypothetical protein